MSSGDTLEHIKIYKKKILKYRDDDNDEKVLYYLNKLRKVSITVKHLEITNIGRTVNEITANKGKVGKLAQEVIFKWKEMVRIQEKEEKEQQKQSKMLEEENTLTEPDSDSEAGLQIEESRESEEDNSHNIYQNKDDDLDSQNGYNPLTSQQDYMNVGQNISYDTYTPASPPPQEQIRSTSKHDYRNVGQNISYDTYTPASPPPQEQIRSPSVHKEARHRNKDDKSSRRKEDRSKHKDKSRHKENKSHSHEKSKSRHRHKNEESKGKDIHKNKEKKTGGGLIEAPFFDMSLDETNLKTKNAKKHSHSSDKSKRQSESKGTEKRNKDSEKKSKEEHSLSCEIQKKNMKSSSKRHNEKINSSHPKEHLSSGMESSKSKKRSTSHHDHPKNSHKKKRPSSDPDIIDANPVVAPSHCLLSSYKPLPKVPEKFNVKDAQRNQPSSEDGLNFMFSLKKTRQKTMYNPAGTASNISSLAEMCIKVLLENIDVLRGQDFNDIHPILERATPQQLAEIEYYNPYLLSDTSSIWESQCKKSFKTQRREEMETWRDMYQRCTVEFEEKFDNVTRRILQRNQVVKTTENKRTTQLAYITPHIQSKSLSRAKVVTYSPEHPSIQKKETHSIPPSGSHKTERNNHRPPAVKKTRVAPLMAKSRQLMKKVCYR